MEFLYCSGQQGLFLKIVDKLFLDILQTNVIEIMLHKKHV